MGSDVHDAPVKSIPVESLPESSKVSEMSESQEAILMLASKLPNNGLNLTPKQIALAIIDKFEASSVEAKDQQASVPELEA